MSLRDEIQKKEESCVQTGCLLDTDPELGRVLEVAAEAGKILLENGAEIFRVEGTMKRIAAKYGVTTVDFFVLSNGIFVTGGDRREKKLYAQVKHIPVKGSRLDRVVEVNQLSREIQDGKYTIDEAAEKLEEIKNKKGKSDWLQILASGVGSACFCIIFGGDFKDAVVAFFAGLLLYVFVLKLSIPHMSKIMGNIFGGGLVAIFCLVCSRLGLGSTLSHMIIGAIIPLVPGVAFTNGVRDIADGDYISGSVRLLDAMLVFLCIAIGVGVVVLIWNRLLGGVSI